MVQSEAASLENFEKLLDDFRQLPGSVERPRTFMEIAGYPHYENVCSNVLAFFMNPEEQHGLGTLVLDALVSVEGSADADNVIGGNVSVEREVITETGNRIDILIASDDYAILIENKIHAGVNNPFDDYSAYLDHVADGREKHKFLLTLYPTSEGSEWCFKNLTHKEFVGQIRSLVGSYVSREDTRYLTIFLDFLNTLENLRRGSRMNQEFVKFLARRSDDVETFSTDLQRFRNELREKVKGLQSLVDTSYPTVRLGTGSRAKLSYTSVHIIKVVAENLLFHINTSISPHGWEIDFDIPRKSDYSKLSEFLQRLEIPFADRERYGFIHPAHFDYDEDLDQIRPVLQDLIEKFAKSQEHEVQS